MGEVQGDGQGRARVPKVAIFTTRFGWDPDNQSVPIITSVMDLVGVLTFLFVLSVFGVAGHG